MRVGAVCVFALMWLSTTALAAECPGNPHALGVSRVISVDPIEHARLGTMQYRETLPLEDGEVVLTFDDGPLPPNTNRMLEVLASECVKATYFLVGRMAQAHPDMVRAIAAAGHTIGTHSQSHPLTFHRMPIERARQEIDEGIASVSTALGHESAPFFRIPGLLRAPDVESYLASHALMTWSADFPADDWKHIGAAEIARRAISRLDAKGKGVLLLHDIHPATVAAMPLIFKQLKAKGYKIVHVVPASAEQPKTATLPSQWLMKPSRDRAFDAWPRVVTEIPESAASPRLPAPGASVLGIGEPIDIASAREREIAKARKPWPRLIRMPSILDLVAREELPAPNPESFGYSSIPAELPPLQPRRAGVEPLVGVPTTAELRPSLHEGAQTNGAGPHSGTGPVTTAHMPRSAFP